MAGCGGGKAEESLMMEITYTGGLKVRAEFDGFAVETDQPIASGGDGTAAGPFDLFVASLGTCAGFYALRFMQQRGIDPTGARLTLSTRSDPQSGLLEAVDVHLELPSGFPDKYRDAVVRAMDQCKVKRQLDQPPSITTSATPAPGAAGDTTSAAPRPNAAGDTTFAAPAPRQTADSAPAASRPVP